MEINDDHLYPGRVFIENILEATDTKVHLSSRITARYLRRAAMAGFLVGLSHVAHHATVATVATVQVGGVTCRVSAVCTHAGGVLGRNDAEKSWDCPLHGSRFAADGTVLEGPAVADLKRHD